MAIDIQALCELVQPHVPGCPQTMAVNALRFAATEFCRFTQVWSVDLDPIDILAGQHTYQITPPENASIAMVRHAKVMNKQLKATTEEYLDERWPGWFSVTAARPTHFMLPSSKKIRLAPTPSQNIPASLVIHAALTPSINATTLEDDLVTNHSEAIANGALSKLLAAPGREWSNPERAQHYSRIFRQDKAGVRANVMRGSTSVPLVVRPKGI